MTDVGRRSRSERPESAGCRGGHQVLEEDSATAIEPRKNHPTPAIRASAQPTPVRVLGSSLLNADGQRRQGAMVAAWDSRGFDRVGYEPFSRRITLRSLRSAPPSAFAPPFRELLRLAAVPLCVAAVAVEPDSMPEQPRPGEHHRDPVLVGRRDHLGVPHRAAGLDNRSHPGRRRVIDPVAEWEERVRRQRRPRRLVPRLSCLVTGQVAGVDARHLARADADRRAVPRQHDRVRLHRGRRLATRTPGPPARPASARASSRPSTGSSPVGTRMRSCTSTPPRTRLMSMPPASTGGSVPISTRRFFFRPSSSAALSAIAGATMHSRKRLDIASAVASSIATMNATTPPNAESGSQASAFCYASSGVAPIASPHGVVCLMIAHATCSRERLDRHQRAVQIEQVVEAQFLAAQLLQRRRGRRRRARRRTRHAAPDSLRSAAPAPSRTPAAAWPGTDHPAPPDAAASRRSRCRSWPVCANTFAARSRRRISVAFVILRVERGDHARVVRWIADHGDRAEVLRGGAEHGRAADIDLLDHVVRHDAGARRRLAERIQVHDHQIDRADVVCGDGIRRAPAGRGGRAGRRAPRDAASSRGRRASRGIP